MVKATVLLSIPITIVRNNYVKAQKFDEWLSGYKFTSRKMFFNRWAPIFKDTELNIQHKTPFEKLGGGGIKGAPSEMKGGGGLQGQGHSILLPQQF